MADLDFSEIDYASITRLIVSVAQEVCDGRIVSVLEGGYNPRSLARSVMAHIRTLAHV
jgi:acetoin utilization deacetylase AcuC-like enzyme